MKLSLHTAQASQRPGPRRPTRRTMDVEASQAHIVIRPRDLAILTCSHIGRSALMFTAAVSDVLSHIRRDANVEAHLPSAC
jgi:hypothetical protein